MIHFDSLADFRKWSGELAAAESTGEIPARRVKAGDDMFTNAAKFHEWVKALEQDSFDALRSLRLEFPDWGLASPE